MTKFFSLSNLTLIVALSLSSVAAFYSIIGLTAIFAGAVIPIIIMGTILEIGKITTTVWLRKYWNQCSLYLKLYLVPAVVLLALLTSMGIFGFLSKAHMDTGLVSGDVQAKLSLIDEKIKTERDNIELARKALQQMDAQVDARLSRGESEAGAERAVQIRRQQSGERTKLQKDISDAQNKIAKLNEERAPIAAENRKVEAEVGPIKYVAALIYGDDPDNNLLERAVRWVIILLVAVFDPLAIALVLAANASREWDKKVQEDKLAMGIVPPKEEDIRPFTEEEIKALDEQPFKEEVEIKEEKIDFSKLSYLNKPWIYKVPGIDRVLPQVYKPEVVEQKIEEEPEPEVTSEIVEQNNPIENTNDLEIVDSHVQEVEHTVQHTINDEELSSSTKLSSGSHVPKFKELDNQYVVYDGKMIARAALQEMKPELFVIKADEANPVSTAFGSTFPKYSNKGDIFVRVDVLPNRVFKFDGKRWIEVNKETSNTYLQDNDYMQFLISKLQTGEYDPELLSDAEREYIETYLKNDAP
jgi:hypothetical protein